MIKYEQNKTSNLRLGRLEYIRDDELIRNFNLRNAEGDDKRTK